MQVHESEPLCPAVHRTQRIRERVTRAPELLVNRLKLDEAENGQDSGLPEADGGFARQAILSLVKGTGCYGAR